MLIIDLIFQVTIKRLEENNNIYSGIEESSVGKELIMGTDNQLTSNVLKHFIRTEFLFFKPAPCLIIYQAFMSGREGFQGNVSLEK